MRWEFFYGTLAFFWAISPAFSLDLPQNISVGIPQGWESASKEAIGTAYEEQGAASPLWFTIANGIISEVFYPRVDHPQISALEFVVTDGEKIISSQKNDTETSVRFSGEGMAVEISGKDKRGYYSYDQEIVTDTAAPVLRIRTRFHWSRSGTRLFFLLRPDMSSPGPGATMGNVTRDALYSSDSAGSVFAAFVPSIHFSTVSAGYSGFTDGWQDLSANFRLTTVEPASGPGYIGLTGEIPTDGSPELVLDSALAFGTSREEAFTLAHTSLEIPFAHVKSEYESGWIAYAKLLRDSTLAQGNRFLVSSPFVQRSAQVIKMHEDKIHRGAIVSSLSKPAIPDSDKASEDAVGYHWVWPRDLYHAAMGLLAAGDQVTPRNVLRFLVQTQIKEGPLAGSWNQNTWADGTPFLKNLEMDQTAFPILLAHHLQKRGILKLSGDEISMIRRAAGFIISHGPGTRMDRWEEIGGYVPSTIAAEVAALRLASTILSDSGTLQIAESWQTNLEKWTFVLEGSAGKNYYLRASPAGTPQEREHIELANGAGSAFASDILDGGFLELVRMRVRDPKDPRILSTLEVYENPDLGIAQDAAASVAGFQFRRFNRDAYGPNHKGGFWPLLAGERGHYAVASKERDLAESELFIMESAASETGLLPEQIIDLSSSSNPSAYKGVARPLVWAHSEDILLHRSIEEGTVFDAPGNTN